MSTQINLGAYTLTRPFKKCKQCMVDLAPSSPDLCSRCELASSLTHPSIPPYSADNDADDNDKNYNI